MLTPRVHAPRIILPLHGNLTASAQMLHHMAMQEAAGTNWRGEQRGFRIAPTSRKNPAFHRKAPSTRLEALAKRALKGDG